METIYPIFRLLFFVWILFLPQFLGVLVHFRTSKFPKITSLIGFLMTTVLSFLLLCSVFLPLNQSNEQMCGTGSGMFALFILFLTGIQIFVSLVVQIFLFWRKK
ncbi:MAG: hypothetical protein K1X72_03865 [Pyrinomonadaceae bacterium]|nr:hypothetical protein [Pyrinomonadaceae bacterium]